MSNLQNLNQQSYALNTITGKIRSTLPLGYFFGIIGSYLINAMLIIFFLNPILQKMFGSMAVYLTIPGALIVQYFRFLIVFTDQLLPTGQQSSKHLVQLVALGMTIWGLAEAYHLIHSFALTNNEFWGVTGFAWSIIIAGYILEISYVKKTNELTNLQTTKPLSTQPKPKAVPLKIESLEPVLNGQEQ